jgi:enterochelin esterase-like enzyme
MKIPARLKPILACVGLIALCAAAAAQPAAVNSHEVNPDHSVTFRYSGPTATAVSLTLDYDHHEIPLKKGPDGVWTYTTGPLQAALHSYGLTVDGVHILDPLNPSVEVNVDYLTNDVRVQGPTPQLWEMTGVPHGVVHHHVYRTAILKNLPDGNEDFFVYTPPGYDAKKETPYPVLYLLHGWSSLANCWVDQGQANLILDNLIAQGRAVPMIVVMPLGYGDYDFVTKGFGVWNDQARIARNLGLFGDALLTEIIPQVEAAYRVSAKRADRAIAGLSMGGGESLGIGLDHLDTFAWIGGFSSAVVYNDFEPVFRHVATDPSAQPSLLWIACGTEDDLLAPNRKLIAWLKARGMNPTGIETSGIHNWPVWRDNLVHFAPLLFRGPNPRP